MKQGETLQVYEHQKAEIDSSIATAKNYPRNITNAMKNMQLEIVGSKEVAESCCFALPTSDKTILGPSVNLAKIIAQNFGNIRYGARVVDIDRTHITSQGMCIDLERNISSNIEVKRSIIGSNGRYGEHLITVTGNAANSIALRNAIFAVVPKSIIDKMYALAKKASLGDVSTQLKFESKRTELITKLKDVLKVTDQEILFACKKEAIEFISTPEDLTYLSALITTIKEGDATVDSIFRGIKPNKTPDINEEEDRLIVMIKATTKKEQLHNLKVRVKTAKQKEAYETKLKDFETE